MRAIMQLKQRRLFFIVLILLSFILTGSYSPPDALANSIWPTNCSGEFESKTVFDKNDVICVSGDVDTTISFWDIWPCADIYIMGNTTWSGGAGLSDAMGSENRICGYLGGGYFFDELIALPPLPVGEYDLIIDEDADAIFNNWDLAENAGPGYAFKVIDLGHPPIDVSGIKSGAQGISQGFTDAINQWDNFLTGLNLLGIGLSLMSGDPMGAAIGVFGMVTGIPTSYNDWALSQGQQMIGAFDPNSTPQKASGLYGNAAKHWYDLYEDPPDPNFMIFASLDFATLNSELTAASVPGTYPFEVKGTDPREAAVIRIANRTAEQSAVVRALRISYEKYQGAYAVSDYDYAYRQAEASKLYADILAFNLNGFKNDLQNYRNTLIAEGLDTFVYDVAMIQALKDRITATGLTAGEIQSLKDAGFTNEKITLLEDYIKAMQVPSSNYTAGGAISAMIAQVDATLPAVI